MDGPTFAVAQVLAFGSTWSQNASGGASEGSSTIEYAAVVISAISLIVSIIFGWRNRSSARKALGLSERQEARRLPQLDLYLEEALSWRQPKGRILGASLLVANPTDRSSALVNCELHLTYASDDVVVTIKIPRLTDAPSSLLGQGVSPIELPARLDGNDARSGWFLFLVPDGVGGGSPIDRYQVVVRDIHGVIETQQIVVFKEAAGDEAS